MTDLNFSGKRVLVTGGAGFVGSNLVERVVSAGGEVVVLDDLFTGTKKNIEAGVDYEFVEGSVVDAALVSSLVKRVDLVAHLAARNIIASTKNPRDDYAANIGGTLNVLMAMREHEVERAVYSSSASVYGNPKNLPISEDEHTHTFSPYAVSKLAGENYCMAFFETYGLPVTTVRYSNIYGPKQDTANPYCGVVARFIELIDRGEPPQLHGDGQQTRDFTYVDDAVDATLVALLSPRADGMVYNLGTGTETKIIEIVHILCRILGKDVTPVHIDRRDIDNIRRRVLNIERIRSRLRWQPTIDLETGLRRTVEWYRGLKGN